MYKRDFTSEYRNAGMWSCVLACIADFSSAVAGSIYFLYRFGNIIDCAEQMDEPFLMCKERKIG